MYMRFTGLPSKQLLDWSLKKLKQEMALTETDKETIAANIGKRCRGSVSVMTSNARVVVSEIAPLRCVNVLYFLERNKGERIAAALEHAYTDLSVEGLLALAQNALWLCFL